MSKAQLKQLHTAKIKQTSSATKTRLYDKSWIHRHLFQTRGPAYSVAEVRPRVIAELRIATRLTEKQQSQCKKNRLKPCCSLKLINLFLPLKDKPTDH